MFTDLVTRCFTSTQRNTVLKSMMCVMWKAVPFLMPAQGANSGRWSKGRGPVLGWHSEPAGPSGNPAGTWRPCSSTVSGPWMTRRCTRSTALCDPSWWPIMRNPSRCPLMSQHRARRSPRSRWVLSPAPGTLAGKEGSREEVWGLSRLEALGWQWFPCFPPAGICGL